MTTAALIVAAGRGTRFRSEAGAPKQYVRLGDRAVLAHTVAAFLRHPEIDHVTVVIHRADAALYHEALGDMAQRCRPPATGGDTRQASVRLGLEALAADPPKLVLIHDAARPFVSADEISHAVGAARAHGAAMVATAVVDTLKRTDGDRRIIETVPRDNMWRAQTPQAFAFDDILLIHREAHASGRAVTDDAALAEAAGRTVHVVPGRADNFKITTLDDLHMAERARASMMETRVGTGFDVHKLGDGDHVWLCGVRIAHSHALLGHSDADVGLHALTDAILGAIGDGDIGAHFPPSDPKWKGAASDQFLADAAGRVRQRGGRIVNVDVTLMCEAPKVGPHRDAMRKQIAEILGIAVDRVGVKATTTEQLGFTGRREGIAAQAVANVAVPSTDRDAEA